MIKSRSILKFFAAQLILFIGVTKTYAIDLHVAVTNNSGLLHLAQALERSPIEGEENLAEIPRTNSDSGALSTRVDRLERELRAMTGQGEELQHKVQMLEEQLRVLRQEPPRTLDANSRPSEPQNNMNTGSSNTAQNTDIKAAKRSDAFNPSADSNAIGAPRPLGATSPSPPLNNDTKTAAPLTQRDVGQPMDLSHSGGNGAASSAPQENDKTKSDPASLSDPKDDYEAAVSTLQAGNFELAEKSFSKFLAKNGKTKYSPAATFYLGESFYLRNRYREAAEKYLDITTKYTQSGQAPDALLRLGQSLIAIGAKEQACASFNEIEIKYPTAPSRVKETAQRESKKIQCK
jgi:tol-pal system protein YbgF